MAQTFAAALKSFRYPSNFWSGQANDESESLLGRGFSQIHVSRLSTAKPFAVLSRATYQLTKSPLVQTGLRTAGQLQITACCLFRRPSNFIIGVAWSKRQTVVRSAPTFLASSCSGASYSITTFPHYSLTVVNVSGVQNLVRYVSATRTTSGESHPSSLR